MRYRRPVKTISELEPMLRTVSEYLKQLPGVCFAILYGSATEADVFHDLDIGLFVDRKAIPASEDLDRSLRWAAELSRQLR